MASAHTDKPHHDNDKDVDKQTINKRGNTENRRKLQGGANKTDALQRYTLNNKGETTQIKEIDPHQFLHHS